MTIEEAKQDLDIDGFYIISDLIYIEDNTLDVERAVIEKLSNKGIPRDLLIVLRFCFSEAMDNTIYRKHPITFKVI